MHTRRSFLRNRDSAQDHAEHKQPSARGGGLAAMDRRTFLQLIGLAGLGATLTGCQPVYGQLLQAASPAGAWPPVDPATFRLLRRLTFGVTGEVLSSAADGGLPGWVEDQLAYEDIDDAAIALRLRPIDELQLDAAMLADLGDRLFDGVDGTGVVAALRQGTLLRQTYSNRQLYEHMVAFWTDHFNVSTTKGDCWFLKVVDDREVIRPNALGSFRELLLGSLRSPAMLVYLDNQANHRDAPNENLAREVLELHTLGIDGGYSQADVEALARSLTGWTVHSRFRRGAVRFVDEIHDQGIKRVLGSVVSSAGEREIEGIADRLTSHPSTATRIATKLVRRFVCDDPSRDCPDLVERAAEEFRQTDGDIRSVVRIVLLDGLLRDAVGASPKLKRPNELIVSALRGLEANTDCGEDLQSHSSQMGQPLFAWPTPDGPPDVADTWRSSMLARWQFVIALANNEIAGTKLDLRKLEPDTGGSATDIVDAVAIRLLGAPLPNSAASSIVSEMRGNGSVGERDAVAFATSAVLASPMFQWR